MAENTVKTPWYPYTEGVPVHLEYFKGSMFDMVASVAARYPNYVAFDFMGKSTTYAKMIKKIEQCAQALKTIGIRKGDCVTIAMPNCPQAIYMFYAINLIRFRARRRSSSTSMSPTVSRSSLSISSTAR